MGLSSAGHAFFTRAPVLFAAAEYDLPGEWEQPDFDDDSEDDADEDDDLRPSSQAYRRRP